MTVKELIEKLKEFPEDMEVITYDNTDGEESYYLLTDYCPQEYTIRKSDSLDGNSTGEFPQVGKKYCFI